MGGGGGSRGSSQGLVACEGWKGVSGSYGENVERKGGPGTDTALE